MPNDQNLACKVVKQTSETHRGDLTSIGDLITADHKILNLDEESRHDHPNALIVQGGYSYWIQKDAAEQHHSLGDSCLSLPRQLKGVYYSVSGLAMDSRYECSSLRNQADRRKSFSTSTTRNISGLPKESWHSTIECDGYSRNVRGKMNGGKTGHDENICCVTFDGLWIPFGATMMFFCGREMVG